MSQVTLPTSSKNHGQFLAIKLIFQALLITFGEIANRVELHLKWNKAFQVIKIGEQLSKFSGGKMLRNP